MNASDPDSDPSAEPLQPEPLQREEDGATAEHGAFLPITLLSLSIAVVLISFVSNASSQQAALKQAIERNRPVLQQAAQLQNATRKLLADMAEIAKDDNDAKLILYRANVRRPDGKPVVTMETSGGDSPIPSGSSGK